MAELARAPVDGLTIRRFEDGAADAPKPFRLEILPYDPIDPSTIPPRDRIYDSYVTGTVSATFGEGGTAKSTLLTSEALAIAVNRDLLGVKPKRRERVLFINLEDGEDEIKRKFAAAMLAHGVSASEVRGWLYLHSGLSQSIKIASQGRNGLSLHADVIEELGRVILGPPSIGVVIIDPFVGLHSVEENNNSGMDLIIKALAALAVRVGCAIQIVAHTRKMGGEAAGSDSLRGGSALRDGIRHGRALNRMTQQEADRFGLESPIGYFRVDDVKTNLAPPSDKAIWRQVVSVDLGNANFESPSDHVGAAKAWTPPDLTDGVTVNDMHAVRRKVGEGDWRENEQATNWVGVAIADVLRLNPESRTDRSRIKRCLSMWLASGALKIVLKNDASYKPRKHVVPGDYNEGFPPPREGGVAESVGVSPRASATAPPLF